MCYALNLRDAYEGFPNSPTWVEGGAFVINKLLSMSRNRPILGCDFIMKAKGLQKFVYEQHMLYKSGIDFPHHLKARISNMFSPYLVDWENKNQICTTYDVNIRISAVPGLHNEITPRDNRMIFIHGKQFVNYKGTALNPFWGVGEAFICIPKVQGNGRRVSVVRAQFGLGQSFLSRSHRVVK